MSKKNIVRSFFGTLVAATRHSVFVHPDNFWGRRCHTLALSGNGAALFLLGSFMGKSDDPIGTLQASSYFFVPFLGGIFAAGLAAVWGVVGSEGVRLYEIGKSSNSKLSMLGNLMATLGIGNLSVLTLTSLGCFLWGVIRLSGVF